MCPGERQVAPYETPFVAEPRPKSPEENQRYGTATHRDSKTHWPRRILNTTASNPEPEGDCCGGRHRACQSPQVLPQTARQILQRPPQAGQDEQHIHTSDTPGHAHGTLLCPD